MSDLAWRREPPDAPGWWWVKLGPDYTAEVVEVRLSANYGLFIEWPGSWEPVADAATDSAARFAGPIRPPTD